MLASNPRYFTDGSGKAVLLSGSHTWLNLQDGVLTDPPPAFNYTGWLDFLSAHNHNFFRLWVWEQAKWSVEAVAPYYFSPMPYQRTGPGIALDGKPRFDLTKFNQAYFDRMRQRVIQAGDRGIYVSIMLFDGWSVASSKGIQENNPWIGHPFNAANNVNSINGDPLQHNDGLSTQDLSIPAVTALQEAYVRKVIDTVNDLNNVLYEIDNEGDGTSVLWQYHMIDLIHGYEAQQNRKRHPVGMTVPYPNGTNASLYNSPADWISPNGGLDNPPAANGSKVVVADTDHLCGICGDRVWVWKAFTRGDNLLFMDQYDDSFHLNDSAGYDMNNPNDVSLRANLGYALTYANKMNLASMTPHGELASSGYLLANPGVEYLAYFPGGPRTLNLSGASGSFSVEWLNPATGVVTAGANVLGGANRSFTPPFSGDAVLYVCKIPSPPAPVPTPPGARPRNYLPMVSMGISSYMCGS